MMPLAPHLIHVFVYRLQLHVMETRRLYAALSAECATLLGELLLEPKAEGVTRQMLAACELLMLDFSGLGPSLKFQWAWSMWEGML
jgi:hypothetical protein